jgi:predicted XRE-type DNA-binding protein
MDESDRTVRGSGNVFADLGFPEPEIELAKAELARQIVAIIRGRKLTQTQAAQVLGIDQPKVSHLVRGRLDLFSTERLLQFLVSLDADVTITVTPKGPSRSAARITVKDNVPGLTDPITVSAPRRGHRS